MWYKPLLMSGLVKHEHHIDTVLYQYCWSSTLTENQKRDVVMRSRMIIGSGMQVYADKDQNLLMGLLFLDRSSVLVRDSHNTESARLLSELTKIGVAQLV
jgi:hypothetical protein